jgi:hypothetical protein
MVHPFTNAEMAIASSVPLTQDDLFHANRACTIELAGFMYETVVPMLGTLLNPTSRELAVATLAYRLCGLVRTAGELAEPHQFQTIAGTARSIYELCVDIELLRDGAVADSVAKFHAFTRAARFSAAFVLCKFYTTHPNLDGKAKAVEQKKLVETPGKEAEMTQLCQTMWNRPSPPRHWSGRNFKEQGVLLGPLWEERHLKLSGLLGWQVHGGGAGVQSLSSDAIRTIELISRELIKEVVPQALHTLANELHLNEAYPGFTERLTFTCEFIETYAAIDRQLQKAGYPSKFAKKS